MAKEKYAKETEQDIVLRRDIEATKLDGRKLWRSRIWGLLVKKFIYMYRKKIPYVTIVSWNLA